MANYIFESITTAQAAAYTASTDLLEFTNSTSHGNAMSVIYSPGSPLTAPTATVIGNTDGHSVVFGSGIYGEGNSAADPTVFPNPTGLTILPDGSDLFIGDSNVN